jgi:hypothetical protein
METVQIVQLTEANGTMWDYVDATFKLHDTGALIVQDANSQRTRAVFACGMWVNIDVFESVE